MTSSFTQAHLGKSLENITAIDLISYFAIDRDESLTLEFKSFYQREGDIKYKEAGVLKAICAFLNSNGGLLIWGAPISTKNTEGHKICRGDLSPVEKRYSKDDLISKISSKIFPFSPSVQVNSVEVEPGKYVYLFDVPESLSKPHQFDDKYYIRLDGQSKPAPHYILDALFKQLRFPNLNVFLRLDGFENSSMNFPERSIKILITCFLINSSKFLHEYDPYYIVSPSLGGFINRSSGEIENFLHIYDIPSLKALTYDIPLIRQEVLTIPIELYYKWCEKDVPIPIWIVGGGKLSPPVKSSYTIKLVDAKQNKNLVLSSRVPIKNIMNLQANDLNYFKHDDWKGSEQERLEDVLKNGRAR
ncbi:AlbA family DNA-binding domain-containing protein [Spirosoma rigui]|uniref:AlbA family DNA-binding domain-containing protein n=1 Tax=Spirosoma rigui TaxID=564064 RepID=UPI0009B1851B|nr:ATP-binding protein [Spirosoma rigui]